MAIEASESKNYPSSDGRPFAESDLHREFMCLLLHRLQAWFAADPMGYVSANLLLYYVRGNKRMRVAPDVFVVKGVAKKLRDNYLLWEEGKGPDMVIEVTSSSTRKEDTDTKFKLYRDILKVREYILFDPHAEYLDPSLQGYRLENGEYIPILPTCGRLPSEVLGLQLERPESDLKLYDPAIGQWILAAEDVVLLETFELQKERRLRQQAEVARKCAEAEVERLRRENEALRNGSMPKQ